MSVRAGSMHDVADGFEQQVDTFLAPHHAHITDEILAARAAASGLREPHLTTQIGTAAHDEHLLGRHAAALDGDASIRFVGRDRHVCRLETSSARARAAGR